MRKNRNLIFTYSEKWFKENLDYQTILIYNFIYLFEYTDNQIRFLHVHKLKQMGIFIQILGIKGKKNIKLEKVCKWFFESYLKSEFNVEGFYFNCPSSNSSYLEKNRTLNSEIDCILKQFVMWHTDKNIDLELLQMSSNHIFFKIFLVC